MVICFTDKGLEGRGAFRRNGAKIIFQLCRDAQCKHVNNFEKIIDEIKITGCDFNFGGTLESPVFG